MRLGSSLLALGLVCAACVRDPAPSSPPPQYPPQPYYYGPPPQPWTAPPPQSWTAPPPASSDRYGAARQRCVDETNAYRARLRLPPLVRRPDKEPCSDADARGDASSGQVHGGAGQCGFGAQNECPGWPGPADGMLSSCLESMFREGPGEPYSAHGHFINMTSREYTGLACGFETRADGNVWLIQNYFR